VKRLNDILMSVGSKYSLTFVFSCFIFVCRHTFFTSCVFRDAAEQLGEIIKLCLDSAKDPLLDTVGVLESNWRNVRNVL
jgi:hypothetical protein